MPVEGSTEKGNLYLTFDIEFPCRMKQETKQCLITALQQNEELTAAV